MKSLARRSTLFVDMDGVLWNSDAIHEAAYRTVLEPIGVNVPIYSNLAGRRTDEVICMLLKQSGLNKSEEEIKALAASKQAFARKKLEATPPLTPNCREVLKLLKSKYRLALASSASKGSVEVFLRTSQTASFFETILSGSDVVNAKPAPDIYSKALFLMNIDASEAYVIEDSVSGLMAAAGAALDVIIYRNHSLRNHASGRVLDVIDTLDELAVL